MLLIELLMVTVTCAKMMMGCLQDTTPWVVVKEDKEHCGALINACAGLCVLLAALVEPYMPSITQKVPFSCCHQTPSLWL